MARDKIWKKVGPQEHRIREIIFMKLLKDYVASKPGDDTSDEDVDALEEDKEILEEVLKLYKQSKHKTRKRRAAAAPGSEV